MFHSRDLEHDLQVEFAVAFLGITAARAVAAPLNSSYTQDEFRFFMEDAASKLLVLPTQGNAAAQRAAAALRVPIATCAVSWSKGATHTPPFPKPPIEVDCMLCCYGQVGGDHERLLMV